ncbi:MAG: hypothetical protein KJ579_00150, partial [Verrucomicrobia bacterium]|nr:hypothetical protein [Verrucomicrobiota bacterium]
MSYFMTVSGMTPVNCDAVEFLPVCQAQDYVQRLARELEQEDGSPLFLAHDCETSTSSGFISDAKSHYYNTGSIDGSSLHAILKACVGCCDAFRIWWASDGLRDHPDVVV